MRHAALVLALAACKHAPPADCGQKAAEVARFLRSANHGGQIYQLAPLAPPLRDDLKERAVVAPSIDIAPDAITYQGQLVDGRDDLASRLRATHDQIADDLAQHRYPEHHPPDADLIAIIADEKAPMTSIVTAVDAAHASGFSTAMFVFRTTPTAAPPRSALDDEIDKIVTGDPSSRATAYAKLASENIRSCPALEKAFGAVTAVEDDKAKFLIDSIEPSLTACQCAVDPYTVRTIMWRLLAETEPTVVLRTKLEPTATPIHAATWGEASKQLTPATNAVWFN